MFSWAYIEEVYDCHPCYGMLRYRVRKTFIPAHTKSRFYLTEKFDGIFCKINQPVTETDFLYYKMKEEMRCLYLKVQVWRL